MISLANVVGQKLEPEARGFGLVVGVLWDFLGEGPPSIELVHDMTTLLGR